MLDRIAKAAFDAYEFHLQYSFDIAPFAEAVGEDTFRKLVDEGVIILLLTEAGTQQTATQARFNHPLKHDYLAAHYLSRHKELWTPMMLDVVSFESNSFDALSMTLELLDSAEQSDLFIQRVHNWNWAAALICIAKADSKSPQTTLNFHPYFNTIRFKTCEGTYANCT